MTIEELFGKIKSVLEFVWVVLWLMLIPLAPFVFCYLLYTGPEWYVNTGWTRDSERNTTVHLPTIISCILFIVFCLLMAIAPYNNYYQSRSENG